MHADAVVVLESFGGLEIAPKKVATDIFLKAKLFFDPVLAASGEFDRISYWQDQLNTKLSPIAEGSRADIILLAEDGRILTCLDGTLFLEGSSFEDAMENVFIIAKRFPTEIGRAY